MKRSLEDIQHFIKKPYLRYATEVFDDFQSLEKAREEIESLKAEISQLKEALAVSEARYNTPEVKLASAIGEFLIAKDHSLSRSDVKQIVKHEVKQHLHVEITEDYDPYSGRDTPYLGADVQWHS